MSLVRPLPLGPMFALRVCTIASCQSPRTALYGACSAEHLWE